ncbi:MAG: helix-turn-helix domain-containing protein [Defluviitaleaceae bacterium]|nr:helix-turn-helix domain-containing protein [Defluviitaleaceae bacterium]
MKLAHKDEYLTINQLAERLNISTSQARQLARSKRLRDTKGAVIDLNANKGKNEILRININKVVAVYAAAFGW